METRAENFQKTPPSVKAAILSVNIPPEYEFTSGHRSTVDGSFAAYQELVRLAIEEAGEE